MDLTIIDKMFTVIHLLYPIHFAFSFLTIEFSFLGKLLKVELLSIAPK